MLKSLPEFKGGAWSDLHVDVLASQEWSCDQPSLYPGDLFNIAVFIQLNINLASWLLGDVMLKKRFWIRSC